MSKKTQATDKAQSVLIFVTDVSTRLSLMITKLDNKIENTEYDSVFNRDCDIDDLRCLKRTLEIFNESNVC